MSNATVEMAKLYPGKYKLYSKICPVCGEPFETTTKTQKYCDNRCYLESNRRKTADRCADRYIPKHIPKHRIVRERRERFEPTATDQTRPCVRCGFNEIVYIHDIIPRADGGNPNNLDNRLPLCPNCHALLHRDKWRLWELDLSSTPYQTQRRSIEMLKNKDYSYKSLLGRPRKSHSLVSEITV